MGFDPNIHHRRSIRLKHFDYNKSGAYFVTICIKKDVVQLSDVTNNKLKLNQVGHIIRDCWLGLKERYPTITLDEYIIMPDHFHGIIIINDIRNKGRASPTPTGITQLPKLTNIVGVFKSLSAIAVNKILDQSGYSIWQRNYYERIIRSENELNKIRDYIKSNPNKLYL